ncbi:DUF6881 domain-containing protein [Larkinella soli]|uniref:DUF6881 domain-containing protein n=1 Tax=Larkinella soli TaxID=1770527 RepID=UPI000FFB24FD|nr:hypothetical protein [Larkinella soli]
MTYSYYTLQDWNGNNALWPGRVYIERNDEGFETRKLIVHSQGTVSFASEGMQQGDCFLQPKEYTAPDPLMQEEKPLITLISQTEFEDTWQTFVLQVP